MGSRRSSDGSISVTRGRGGRPTEGGGVTAGGRFLRAAAVGTADRVSAWRADGALLTVAGSASAETTSVVASHAGEQGAVCSSISGCWTSDGCKVFGHIRRVTTPPSHLAIAPPCRIIPPIFTSPCRTPLTSAQLPRPIL